MKTEKKGKNTRVQKKTTQRTKHKSGMRTKKTTTKKHAQRTSTLSDTQDSGHKASWLRIAMMTAVFALVTVSSYSVYQVLQPSKGIRHNSISGFTLGASDARSLASIVIDEAILDQGELLYVSILFDSIEYQPEHFQVVISDERGRFSYGSGKLRVSEDSLFYTPVATEQLDIGNYVLEVIDDSNSIVGSGTITIQ